MSDAAKKLLEILLDLHDAGRPHGTNPRTGDSCECDACENWDKAGDMDVKYFDELREISTK